MYSFNEDRVYKTPLGVKIVTDEFGNKKIISENFFKKGEIMYTDLLYVIPNKEHEYKMKILDNDNITTTYNVTNLNSVKVDDFTRLLFVTDGFMNHSCDPNTDFTNLIDLGNGIISFNDYASKDINIGDELTCNYLWFDYECDGHSFNCKCNCVPCYGNINGFKNLSSEEQDKIIHKVPDLIKNYWKNKN
jgi:hypothetical protein